MNPLIERSGQLLWVGRFDHVLAQIRAMARREVAKGLPHVPAPFALHPSFETAKETRK